MTTNDGLRPVLYHRFHFLVPLLNSRVARKAWRVLVWGFWLVYFGFILVVLALRYSILPNIEHYRGDIEQLASRGLGQSVSIGRIEASWDGINPDLTLLDVRIADAEGRPALAFSRIEAVLSWWSVPTAQLNLRLLRIDEPTLNLRRDAEGRYFVAGIPLAMENSDGAVSDWVLAQRRIRIRGATVVWEDDLRKAPMLVLEDLDFALDNDGRSHRFGLTALPPKELATRIDVRGDFRGTDIEHLAAWSGEAYAEIGYADLAVWRQWIDYPVALPRGRGALRTWLGVADGRVREITSDLLLQDVRLQLAKNLPVLELDHLSGRIGARFTAAGFVASGRHLELATRAPVQVTAQANESPAAQASIRIEPMDFQVDWRPLADGRSVDGSASASRLDIGALARLAEYLPLDARSRQLLAGYEPRGQVNGLSAKWRGDAERLQMYSFKAGFADMALKAQGAFPGFSGLAGSFEASEKGGTAIVHSKKPTLDLPGVFPVSLIALDELDARTKWQINEGELDVELSSLDFAGPEAAGSAQGRYRTNGTGPGNIDLTAALTRADARAVWRYMPHAVGEGARLWLRDSLLAGHSSEAKLVLKGDLADFPFLDKSKGEFLVTVKARDVVLDYGEGWPRIEKINGNLRFEGNGMVVDAQQGSMLGAKLSKTRAEIPDFDAPISTLKITGQADGPTAEFLKFIDQSPVAERIDRFTEDMRASGAGHLDLNLMIPLDEEKLGESRIDGAYRFVNNDINVDAALPPIRQVNGSVKFSGADLQIPEINGSLFGGPLKIKGGLQKDGRVLITADGSIDMAQLRQQNDSPLLAQVSGSTPYRGEVRINKRNADLVIESSLLGLASTFPAPFDKAAAETLPLRFEKTLLTGAASPADARGGEAPVRDRITLGLGDKLAMQLIRRKQTAGFVPERGAVAVGRPLQLPERGITFAMTAAHVDLDQWRRLLSSKTASAGPAEEPAAPSGLAFDELILTTPDLVLFGRHLNDVDLAASAGQPSGSGAWKARLSSRQASGDLTWDGASGGKLSAHFQKMRIEPSNEPVSAAVSEPTEKLPALDIVADDFALGERRFGRLELHARNEGNLWHLSRIETKNPAGTFSGSGQWQVSGERSRTQLDFKVDSGDVGSLLDRLGYPGTVRAGTAQLAGKVAWNGAPTDLDFASLNGDLDLQAAKGQFVKLNPGATGKLLGLISLQGLPRRISLDFRDVFSEGLAFDSLTSKVAIQNGLMRTERLQIDGPSARVVMRGEVDLKHETQRLNVNVQPELGGTAALGVAIVNPIAGVATWVAHKVLQNPLNQMFGFDYLVTGTWDDPKVEKISKFDASASEPRLPTIPPTIPSSQGTANEPAAK